MSELRKELRKLFNEFHNDMIEDVFENCGFGNRMLNELSDGEVLKILQHIRSRSTIQGEDVRDLKTRVNDIIVNSNTTWKSMRINRSFEQSLRKKFGRRTFTNAEAYKLYAREHANKVRYFWTYEEKPRQYKKEIKVSPNEPWLQMNVRNNLCALAHERTLERIEPGVYWFIN